MRTLILIAVLQFWVGSQLAALLEPPPTAGDKEEQEVLQKQEALGDAYLAARHQGRDIATEDWFRARMIATLGVAHASAEKAISRSAGPVAERQFLRAIYFARLVAHPAADDVIELVFSRADTMLTLIDEAYASEPGRLKAVLSDADWEYAERLRGLRTWALEASRENGRGTFTETAMRLTEADPATRTAALAYLRRRASVDAGVLRFLAVVYRNRTSRAFRDPALVGIVEELERNEAAPRQSR